MFGLPPLPPHFHAAVRDVEAKRPESRMAAAERLGRAEGENERTAALAGLARLAKDPHAGVRATALAALGLLADEGQLEIVSAGLSDPFPEVREFAALALGQIGGAGALSSLKTALRHTSPEVRFHAAAGVAELDPDHAAAALVPLLDDPDPDVRAQVVSALSSLDEPHLTGQLARGLSDAVWSVRLEAALALASHADSRGEQALLTALARRERVTEVIAALVELKTESAREPLAQLASAWLTPPATRASAGAALARLGDPRGLSALRRVLHGLRSEARSYAVELTRELAANAELGADLARLADRPRGADLLALVDALAHHAVHSPPARSALERLAARSDAVGHAARELVQRTAFERG
ncbi:MAG: HEAT repeat domain-containing protein [Myxococcales bacterium]